MGNFTFRISCNDFRVKANGDILRLCFKSIEDIAMHLTLKEVYRYIQICKQFSLLSDRVWDNLCNTRYPKQFWIRAMQRPVSISKPLSSAKEELKRLTIFETRMFEDGVTWTLSDYYLMWDHQDVPHDSNA